MITKYKNVPHYAFEVDGEITHGWVNFPFIPGALSKLQMQRALGHYCEHHSIQLCGVKMIPWNGDKPVGVRL